MEESGWIKPYSISQSEPEVKCLLQGGVSGKGSYWLSLQTFRYLIKMELCLESLWPQVLSSTCEVAWGSTPTWLTGGHKSIESCSLMTEAKGPGTRRVTCSSSRVTLVSSLCSSRNQAAFHGPTTPTLELKLRLLWAFWCRCWELNSHSLQGLCVLITTGPSCQPVLAGNLNLES